jgi:hypothetical protein
MLNPALGCVVEYSLSRMSVCCAGVKRCRSPAIHVIAAPNPSTGCFVWP